MGFQEQLLQAWIEMTVNIRGNRIVKGLSFNEIIICHYLYHCRRENGEWMSATELGERTRLLKSQINRVLTSMEIRGMIRRVRNEEDQRKIKVILTEEGLRMYLEEHRHIMGILRMIEDELGTERTELLAELMSQAVETVNRAQEQ